GGGEGEKARWASGKAGVGEGGQGTGEIANGGNVPGRGVGTVGGDDVVNIIEHGQALVITGSSSDLAAGSNVTLTINGQTYVAAVLAGGPRGCRGSAGVWRAVPSGGGPVQPPRTTPPQNPGGVQHRGG
ncbi:hypothetical protein ACISSW_29030, partial [Escherichia coli]